MIRVKYVNNLVYIDDTDSAECNKYKSPYEQFVADCEELNIPNPFIEGEFVLYTPPRKDKDRERGLEKIDKEGSHSLGDDIAHPKFQTLLNNVDVFVDKLNANKEAKAKKSLENTPKEIRLKNAYLAKWPVHKQLEAFQDALNGDNSKLNQMNIEFAEVKDNV